MNPNQQFQANAQRMREQQHRMEEGHYWATQQEKLRKDREGSSQQEHLRDKFRRLEGEASRLRQEFDAGRLSEEELKEHLGDLTVRDYLGAWWMIDWRTGRWFRRINTTWAEADPYQPLAPGLSGVTATPRAQPHRFSAVLVLLFGLPVAVAAGFGTWSATNADHSGPAFQIGAIAVGAVGVLLTLRSVRRRWRGY